MDWDRKLRDIERGWDNRAKNREKSRDEQMAIERERVARRGQEMSEKFRRLSGSDKERVIKDTLQPTGKTKDAFYKTYGYIPGETDPAKADEVKRRFRDERDNAKYKKFY